MPNWCLHSQSSSSSLIMSAPFLCYKGDPFQIGTKAVSVTVASDLPTFTWACLDLLSNQTLPQLTSASIQACTVSCVSCTGQGSSPRRAEKSTNVATRPLTRLIILAGCAEWWL